MRRPVDIRVFERGAGDLGVCARIYEIDDQALVRGQSDDERITWSLYFDVIETSPRRAYNAVHNHDRAEDIEWRATLSDEATVVDGVLRFVEGSTSASVQDLPDPPLPATRDHRRRRR